MNLELTPSALLYTLSSNLRHCLNAQDFAQRTNLNPNKKVLIAYSGGLDSHVLLHLFSRIPRDQFELRAVYIDHGLQTQSSKWAHHCQRVCEDLDVSFTTINLNLEIPKGESLEEVARKARYKALYAELQEDEILVTAHHQNDQAETLLLQLFRGAGVQGLAAMPVINEIKTDKNMHFHVRPLLEQSRQALEDYAKEFKLEHIEDPSNQDITFDRNFLRQEIMPLLRHRWLGIDKSISRAASLQAETKSLLDEVSEQELPSILVLASEPNYFIHTFTDNKNDLKVLAPIAIPELLKNSQEKQRLLIRYWITQQGFSAPSAKKLQHIFSDVIKTAKDKQPCVEWKGAELRRFQSHLYIMSPLTEHDITQVIPWQNIQPLYIPSINFTLEPQLFKEENENITVRFRHGGESIEIPKRGNISLKNLFQELQVPPWIRGRLPLIYAGEKLLKICGLEELKAHPPTF